jgi:hypothetical protein
MKICQGKGLRKISKSILLALAILSVNIYPGKANSINLDGVPPHAGVIWSWGFNYHGQLGNSSESYNPQPIPAKILNLSSITEADGGSGFGMALDLYGNIWTWGDNSFGELGNGTTTDRFYPNWVVLLSSDHLTKYALSDITAIAAGSHHCLALKNDGTVWAWGFNGLGSLGIGSTVNSFYPVKVASLSGITAIAAGGDHSMALKSDGTVWAWGSNSFGELGDGSTSNRPTPVQVDGLSNVTAISGGASHSLALKSDGTVWAWGRNTWGQLGDDSTTDRNHPVQVANLSDVSTITAGGIHSMALKNDGTVWSWGNNYDGQLGVGNQLKISSAAPTLEPGEENTTRIFAGFGNNLESSDLALSDNPIQVSGISNVTMIAAGEYHSLALTSEGKVWAWGYNGYGELGNGTTDTSDAPVLISSLAQVVFILAGSYDSMAILTAPHPAWDVNGDHIANVGDLIMVGSHWNEEGTPGWIPEDVNMDGFVNVGDLIIIGSHWNETW